MKRTPKNTKKKEPIKGNTSVESVVEDKKPISKTVQKTTPKPKKEVKKLLRWKKITSGVHYFKGLSIRKGDILECQVHEMSDIVKRHFVCLDEIPEEKDEGKTLKVQSLGDGKFNVVNPKTNEPINEKELTKDEAKSIVGESVEE